MCTFRRGVVVEEPYPAAVCFRPAMACPSMSHPRNLILVDEQSQVAIVEEYVSLGWKRIV